MRMRREREEREREREGERECDHQTEESEEKLNIRKLYTKAMSTTGDLQLLELFNNEFKALFHCWTPNLSIDIKLPYLASA